MLSRALHALIETARQEVRRAPHDGVRAVLRARIYAALGPSHAPWGRKRRGVVSLIVAQRVWPLWQQWADHYRAGDERAVRLLSYAERLRRDDPSVERAAVKEEALAAWWWLMDRAYMGEDADLPPLASECAFFALVRAVFAFVTEDDMDWPADMTGVIEIELDPWTADAVEWALGALYPRGTGTAEDKETFWTWWLTEAVPQAWMSAKKDE